MTTIDEALDAFLAEQDKRLAERTYRNYLEQIGDVEGRASRRHDDESVGADHVGPLTGQGDQLTAGVHDVDPVCLPVLAALDELELLASPGMERVGDSDPLSGGQVLRITCS